MKALKLSAIVLGVIFALVALVVALALIPAVQTWAVRKAVGNQPGMTLEIGRVAAGFSAADLTDVRVVKDGVVVTAKSANARYSAWDYLTHKRVNVADLTVQDLVIDLRAATPAAQTKATNSAAGAGKSNSGNEPASQKPFNGFLTEAQLPMDVHIAHFSIPGRALLSSDQIATFDVHGSNLSTGQNGTIEWKVDLTDAASHAPMRALHSSGTAALHITTERRIDVADVNAIASVEGPKLPADQIKLEAKAEQPAAGGNEGYTAHVSLVRGGTTEPLLTLAGQFDARAHQITGAWNISVRSEQVADLLSGFGLPDTAITGAGKFSMKPDTAAITANGELQSNVSHLEKISAELGPIGSLRVQTKFDGGLADNVAQIAQFTLSVTAANGRKFAEIDALQKIAFSLADKRVSFADAKADLARISVQALPLAWAQPFAKPMVIESGDLSLVLAVAAEADGSRVRVTSAEPLALRNVTVRNGAQKLADQVTLTAKPQAEYSADRLRAEIKDINVSTPAGDAVTGGAAADISHLTGAREIAFTSETTAKIVTLLKPYLSVDTGPLTVLTKTEGNLAGTSLRLKQATTRVTRGQGTLLAQIDLQQPIAVDLKSNAIAAEKPDNPTARVQLGEIPLAWAEPFVAQSKLGGQIAGATLDITLRSIDDIAATTTQPVVVRGATASLDGKPMAQNLDVSFDFSGGKKGDAVRYDVRRLEAKQGQATLATLVVAGNMTLGAKPTVQAKGTLEADAAALMQQPAAVSFASLSRGKVNASFDATIAETIQAKATLAARGLVAKQNNQPLGDAELTLTATVQSDGSSVLKVPFTLTNGGRKSDVSVDGKLSRANNTINFDGRITSTQLFVDDLKPLAGLASSGSTTAEAKPTANAASPRAPAPATSGRTAQTATRGPGTPAAAAQSSSATAARDTEAFWAAAGGKIEVDLKQISMGKDYTISGVRGSATITPAKLALPALEGQFKGNPFKVSATIDFDAKQAQPYTLAATAHVTEFDVGEFMRAAEPNEKPQLETNVTVDAKVNGKGANLERLTQNAYGSFDVAGSKGVFRALSGIGGQLAGGASGVLGIIGQATNQEGVAAAGSLARKLTDMPFDKFVMHAERGADLNLNVSKIEFISPDTRITGSGGITHQANVPIQNQPMRFVLQLAGKDEMGFLMNKAHLLGGNQDELGYYTMSSSFTLAGTPTKPDARDLGRIVLQAAMQSGTVESLLKRFVK